MGVTVKWAWDWSPLQSYKINEVIFKNQNHHKKIYLKIAKVNERKEDETIIAIDASLQKCLRASYKIILCYILIICLTFGIAPVFRYSLNVLCHQENDYKINK